MTFLENVSLTAMLFQGILEIRYLSETAAFSRDSRVWNELKMVKSHLQLY